MNLIRWTEKMEPVFSRSDCAPENCVKFATGTLEGHALTWWDSKVQALGLNAANALTWEQLKDMMREEYCPRSELQKLDEEF